MTGFPLTYSPHTVDEKHLHRIVDGKLVKAAEPVITTRTESAVAPPSEAAPQPIHFVYIAGPITLGDWHDNIRRGLDANKQLIDAGLAPFCPHLSCYAQIVHPVDYEHWLAYDFAWIERCDALLRLPGKSFGADREVEHAMNLGLHVFEVSDVATIEVFVELVKLNNVRSGR